MNEFRACGRFILDITRTSPFTLTNDNQEHSLCAVRFVKHKQPIEQQGARYCSAPVTFHTAPVQIKVRLGSEETVFDRSVSPATRTAKLRWRGVQADDRASASITPSSADLMQFKAYTRRQGLPFKITDRQNQGVQPQGNHRPTRGLSRPCALGPVSAADMRGL
jgi:hypothetical protein